MNSIIYGPVPSWRLGKSLGIDLLSTKGKTCSFDCVYCQLGRTVHPLSERREFVSLGQLTTELQHARDVAADYATFSGVGEPTLASNLGEAIIVVKAILHTPVAVLTNSSLISREDVRRELAQADVVVAKLDAPTEEVFHSINKPVGNLCLDEIANSIRLFRSEFKGKLALQMMFLEANKRCAPEMARMAEKLSPDEVQINTPLRPCGVKPLPPEDIAAIKLEFTHLGNVFTVYEASRPEVTPFDPGETLRRRPKL
jgi:wyosine [tRNA(Phe)-imidazoG37] synthetase (radical SAM superfamily)